MAATPTIAACEWRVGDPGPDEIRIIERAQRDGTVLYAVKQRAYVANREQDWELEPIPGERDHDFIARTRWDSWPDAAYIAIRMAVAEARA